MKRSGNRLLAVLLCFAMALSLLPIAAFASWDDDAIPETPPEAEVQAADRAELPEDAPEGGESANLAETLYPDGAVADTWKQDENTVRGTGSVCAVEEGRLHLKGTSTNTNNGGTNPNPPAIFINETMNAALAASEEEEKALSFDVEPVAASVSGNPLFGLYLNYKSESGAVWGKAICVDTNGGHWFWQSYYAGADSWGNIVSNNTAFNVAGKNHIELKWKDTAITSFKVNDTVLVSSEITMEPIVDAIGQLDTVGFKVGSHENSVGDFYISNLYYTGQEALTSYTISGMVQDGSGNGVKGAAVTAMPGNYTATSGANGAYSLTVPVGEFTVTASKAGYANGSATVAVTNSNKTQNITMTLLPKVSGVVNGAGGAALAGATVTLTPQTGGAKTATTDASGAYEFIGVTAGSYTLTVTAVGYAEASKDVEVTTADVPVEDINLTESLEGMLVLEGDGMDVLVDEDFPRVIQYRLKNDLGTMDGQKNEIDTIKINGTDATLGTITSALSADKKTVTYTIPMTAPVNATMTARLTVDTSKDDMKPNVADSASKDYTLGFFIDKVEYTNNDRLTNPVKNIEIPNHSLVSVNSTQPGAQMTGAKMGNSSVTTNDVTYLAASNKTLNWSETYFAAFISNNSLAASITSNSSINGGGAAAQTAPNEIRFVTDGENCTIGLSSIAWPYDYLLADSNPRGEDHTANLTAEQKVISEDRRETPFAKVVIAPELNNDDTVNWQDGAIALRETVLHIPVNSEQVRDQVSTRIALNFGSQAQNPFLTSLDNAKRVAANTDGLGQMIVLKGYANEGHDSGHPDYWDMGTRMGGPTDFATMLKEGKKVGAFFGIHINASEMYAEAKAMEENFIRYRGLDNSIVNWGWHWHDTAIKLRALYDLGTGNRAERFRRLANEGGGELSLIYVDVWGNASGGTEDSWQTRMLSNEITQMENKGWRIAHEWSYANPYDSTWQHWTTDYGYGGHADKGQLNSAVIRFLLNQYKDSFPPDFATFGGGCNAPLLGGPAMQGFEGWQGDGEYDLHIYNTFNQMIATKFLQHFAVTNWTNAENAVAIPYSTGANGAHNMTQTANWKPEMQVKLEGKIRTTDAETAKIVVTRGLDETLDTTAVFNSLDDEATYRSRVMTLNGKVILKGAPASAGEDTAFPASKATLEYLIPWYWTADGKTVDAANEKLYYWNGNQNATTSTEWTLPDGWESLTSVILYELSDQGRDAGTTVAVSGGKVTFHNIKAETPYVVVKGENGPAAPVIEYTAKGQHMTDPSFNDAKLSAWTITGSGKALKVDSVNGISVMKQTGEVAASQVLTEMKPNTKYVAYVAVENKDDAKAYIKVTDASGNELAYNYTTRSIATNYIGGNSLNNRHGVEAGGSKMQNMYVFFTTPASGNVTLTLGREAGEGNVFFDSTRVLESQMAGYTYDKDGNINGLTQDFEHSAQGEWPFVVSGFEGVEDNRQHLSEKNAPYTQSGWNIKEVDDVISGNWSLKTHGLTGGQNLVYQTIPQNFRFEPGKTYTVSFDYEMGMEDLMQVVIGDGAWNGIGNCQTIPLEMAKGAGFKGYGTATQKVKDAQGNVTVLSEEIPAGTGAKTCTFTVVGSESGQTWIGIATAGAGLYYNGYYKIDQVTEEYKLNNGNRITAYRNLGMPDDDEYGLFFSGRGDFILDNLKIAVSNVDKSELSDLAATAGEMEAASYTKADNYSGTEEEAWNAFDAARTAAQTVLDNPKATQTQVNSAKTALENAIKNLKKVDVVITGTVTGVNGAPVVGATVTLENSDYRPVGLTATTDAEGKFRFASTEDVNLNVMDYELKVQATGYQVNTFSVTGLTKTAPTKVVDACALVAEAPGAYVNDFNDGDVSMMGALTTGDDIPTWEAINYNGSGALKVTFNSTAGETRGINNVVDKTVQIKNGTVSFDVTGLTNTFRLGVTLRATGPNDRIFVGQEDAVAKWFWQWWKTGVSTEHYETPAVKDIGIYPGETRRVRVELADENVQVFIDGVQIYNATMTGAPDTAGWVGINMRNNAGTSYILDNLRIVSTDEQTSDKYTISGAVTADSKALAGAAVSILSGQTLVTGTTTNAAGAYKTQPLDPGTYTIKVTAPNYTTLEENNITITDANITDKNFTMSVDKSALESLYNTNKDTSISGNDRNNYTQESFKALTDALAAAKTVLDDANATAAQIGEARMALEEAVEGLTAAPTDYSALREVYDSCKDLLAKDYTSETFGPFETARTAAYELLFGEDVLQSAVDAAKTELETTLDALVIIPADNKDALNAAIEAAAAVTNSGYTNESWNAFQEKLDEAKTIAEDETGAYTQTQVDNATKALIDAQAALTKKPSQPSGGNTTPSETTTTETRDDGTTVTTVTKPDGSKTQTVEQPDGTKSELVATKDGDVTITVTDKDGEELVKAEIPATIPETETRFEDVPVGHWADKAIHNAAALDLVNGTGDNKYSPVAPMTRGSLATVLHRLSQGKTDYEVTFRDVAETKFYAPGVAWAAKAGVVTGYTTDIFAPEDIITREQLAVMLARYAKLIGMNTKADAKALDKFNDGANTGSWAVDGMAWCVENGIIQGKDGNRLDPTTNVSRAEVAMMLDRFIALIK